MSDHTFLTGLTTGFTPVIDAGFSSEDYFQVDLSVNNEFLSDNELNTPEALEAYLEDLLQENDRKVAYGGYDEIRGIYKRSDLFSLEKEVELVRNIHIGLDIWAAAGTPVLSVLPGTVHSFKDNANFGDYGPTIILEHVAHERTFYSLYGHLSRASLQGLVVGQRVDQGQQIAELGNDQENGNYAPHLHFQIILDMEGKQGDYPGVTNIKNLSSHLNNCPDPNLLLKITRE